MQNQDTASAYGLCAATFSEVLRSYARIKQQSPITAQALDPDARLDRLSTDGIIFTCDVELATEAALRLHEPMQAAWFDLLLGRAVPRELKIEVVARCGREYLKRGLAPHEYFRQVRHASGEHS